VIFSEAALLGAHNLASAGPPKQAGNLFGRFYYPGAAWEPTVHTQSTRARPKPNPWWFKLLVFW